MVWLSDWMEGHGRIEAAGMAGLPPPPLDPPLTVTFIVQARNWGEVENYARIW